MTPSVSTSSANRFQAWEPTELVTESKHGKWKGGRHIGGGYVRVKVKSHPKQDSRGYVLEHVLVMENNLMRYLRPGEYVHHKDSNRQNNAPENLELMYSHKQHMDQHPRARNQNKQFVAADPIFDTIKFRLHDVDAGVTKVYTLSKLINTTFRRGKFQFRGRWTGLTDKNGKEIWEGDIVQTFDIGQRRGSKMTVEFRRGMFCTNVDTPISWNTSEGGCDPLDQFIVIGNIYENPDLLPKA